MEIEMVPLPDRNKWNVVTAGDFSEQNHYEKLLEAFGKVAEKKKNVHLYILGDHPQIEALRELSEELGISGMVSFPGKIEHPLNFIRRCQCFAMESVMGEQAPNSCCTGTRYSGCMEIQRNRKGSARKSRAEEIKYGSV